MASEIDDLGDTPLIRAAKERDETAVAALVARGVSLDDTNRVGQTALSWAVRHGDLGVVKKLLAAGASPGHAPPPACSRAVGRDGGARRARRDPHRRADERSGHRRRVVDARRAIGAAR